MAERNRFIDFAKGIAIIFVLFNHHEWQDGSMFGSHLYYWIINMAVPIFMLCTGYVTAASWEAKKTTIKQSYSWEVLSPKLSRYVMPVLWFYIVETILVFIFQETGFLDYLSNLDFAHNEGYKNKMTFSGTLLYFFAGGRGQHGTYYFSVILQVAFMMPLIYLMVKKWKWGIWLCFGINLALEILKLPLGISRDVYRLLAFRYIFVLAIGCYLFIYRENLGKWYKWVMFFLLGAGYIYLVNYTSYNRVVFKYWYSTSMIAIFYIVPLFMLGLKYLKNVKCKIIEQLGKASYHILLVQIIYYNFFAPLVWTAPKNIIPNDAVAMLINLIVCLGGGYAYFRLYEKLRQKSDSKKARRIVLKK